MKLTERKRREGERYTSAAVIVRHVPFAAEKQSASMPQTASAARPVGIRRLSPPQRYNTLYLASKVVCQRRAAAPLWNPPEKESPCKSLGICNDEQLSSILDITNSEILQKSSVKYMMLRNCSKFLFCIAKLQQICYNHHGDVYD